MTKDESYFIILQLNKKREEKGSVEELTDLQLIASFPPRLLLFSK